MDGPPDKEQITKERNAYLGATPYPNPQRVEKGFKLKNTDTIRGLLKAAPPEDRSPRAPIFTGRFQVVGEHGTFNGAAWSDIARKGTSAGKPYLSLLLEPLGADGKPFQMRGWMFEAEARATAKSCDFYGQMRLGTTDQDLVMRIAAWRRQGGEFLSVVIEPPS
jgi:hypothetical protein